MRTPGSATRWWRGRATRRTARGVEEAVQRQREMHVHVEVEPAEVVHRRVAEEVDALDGRVDQRLVQWQPAGLSLF